MDPPSKKSPYKKKFTYPLPFVRINKCCKFSLTHFWNCPRLDWLNNWIDGIELNHKIHLYKLSIIQNVRYLSGWVNTLEYSWQEFNMYFSGRLYIFLVYFLDLLLLLTRRRKIEWHYKLDRVAPLITDPPPTSCTTLSKKRKGRRKK